ncbi:MAG: hypothetical protein ACHRXM_15535 [Isosphaerales bacterium]
MSDLLLIIIILVLLAILAVLIDLALKARAFRGTLEQLCRILFKRKPGGHHGFDHVGPPGPFAIWCYTNGKWVLLTPCGQTGCDCGPPPPQPGSYDEQVIRKECPKR